MHRTRLGALSSIIVAAFALSGCTAGATPADGSGKPGAGDAVALTPVASRPASPAVPSAPALDAATKTACAQVSKDIKAALAKAAKAEKIGPPAGYAAVSAQYSAGASAIYANVIGANAAVNGAARQVATAMGKLADIYATAPRIKPSRQDLEAALKNLTAACSGA
ncbi:hypothetical protein [Krasilnikovia sp. M28-CT-15]|uniref:hypothetical protein n=1 Tax=Krasilnikovia sp. M28-CT-15 TaxID=3373540 RepID=UPI0038763A51